MLGRKGQCIGIEWRVLLCRRIVRGTNSVRKSPPSIVEPLLCRTVVLWTTTSSSSRAHRCPGCALCGFGQFPLPAGQGVVSFIVRVMGSIKSSNAITYTYPLPTVTNVLPRSFPTTGGTRLVITGSNLGIDIEVEYQHRLASHGPSERVLPLNDTIPNQVVLVQNSVAHPCVVTTVRFTLLTTLERRAASRGLVCRVFSRPVCRFMLVWLIFSCVMLFFLFG